MVARLEFHMLMKELLRTPEVKEYLQKEYLPFKTANGFAKDETGSGDLTRLLS